MQRWLLSLDVVAVMAFVSLGRDTHEEGLTLGGIIHTAAPFLIGLVVGWIVTRAWRAPLDMAVGAGVLGSTLVIGVLLRPLLFDDGIAVSFILVAAIFLAVTMLGWRAVVGWLLRRRGVTVDA